MWVLRFMLAICLGTFSSYALDLTHRGNTNGINLHKSSFHLNKNIKLKTSKLPDLTIKSVQIKSNIKAGDFIGKRKELSFYIANRGKADAPKSILKLTCRTSSGTCPKILNSSTILNPIKHGRTLRVYMPKNTSRHKWTKGLYYVTSTIKLRPATTFSTNTFHPKESNTHNNTKHFSIKVKSNEYVDLAIRGVKLSRKICAEKRVSQSGKIEVKITNLGNLNAPKSTMCIRCKKVNQTMSFTTVNLSSSCPSYLSGYAKIPPIKSGKSFVLRWPFNSSKIWEKGKYKLLFNANCTTRDGIKEHDTYDNNNKKIFKFEVKNCKSKLSPIKHINIGKKLSPMPKNKIIFKSIFPSHWKQGHKYYVMVKGDKFNKNIRI